jgi:tellurite resistance protein TerC
MDIIQLSYLLFIVALAASMFIDFMFFSRRGKKMTVKAAAMQYSLWFSMAIAYFFFLYYNLSKDSAILYLSAYFTEVSLSIDNLFVFILIFTTLKIREKYVERVLTIGILLAILFRLFFIFVGISLVTRFEWIMLVFGAFLVYTGLSMFWQKEEEENIKDGTLYKIFNNYLRFTEEPSEGKYIKTINGKKYFTILSLAVVMVGFSDLIFAVDSIPAVLAITTDKLVVYSSNIFAILGLRALYFILLQLKDKFDYVQQGVSVVLVFIGLKILLCYFFHDLHEILSPLISFGVIITVLGGSVVYSLFNDKAVK